MLHEAGSRAAVLGGWIGASRSDELGAREPLDVDLTAPDGWMVGGSVEVAGCSCVGEEGIWEDPKGESGGGALGIGGSLSR